MYEHLLRAVWKQQGSQCHGVWRNNVCVYGLNDLPLILNHSRDGVIFANKFQTDVDPDVVPCLIQNLE